VIARDRSVIAVIGIRISNLGDRGVHGDRGDGFQ